ncbi:MAG: pyridoxal-phosphate dependent enzyme [Candidatus Thermoplasmatota archaeon]|nr:pyridoxal-phosphate dependent enzyme [Euryarchaeota archaeon]MBU4032437.1 pyridoxal-phosphate dependent enzyme [Candidatus Thermoplasmatota archaeon]MBU4072361.1 pyridoxal-phosphate dependent enzyme [Candidatus Thermoplasmatota archaeon]MBU4144065.1 pyridoxal-phosphate dependent enzyme [Candidatus Thermoplasmatota archaeon]MBU4591541.1 pyridoxal-phosphate dependent enzyme [Candidatus Thermoplasmatota archaeon]
MLDGASSYSPAIPGELDDQRKVAADHDRSLEDRLEAFEDIKDSEVGDTNMARARNVEHLVGLRQIYLKFDGGNPTGTQKDRIAFAQAMDALRRGYDTITVATCGNYGAAIALAASVAGLKCVIYIPETFHTKRIKEMEDMGAIIRRIPGNYEEAVIYSTKKASEEDMYDANPGGVNTTIQLKGYAQIAFEIYDELRDAPFAVAAPVSNGTTLAGIYRGFVSLYRRGKTSRIPRIVAGSSFGKNPIVQAYLKNKPRCEDLPPQAVKETEINEPLINWHSIDGDLALDAIRASGGWADNATDKEMLQYAKLIREKEGMNVLPASTAGLIALLDRHAKEHLPGDRYVVILTGRKT